MEETLQRYLDGVTGLLSLAAGELVALGLPDSLGSAAWLWGIGFAAVAWTAAVVYQRDLLADSAGESDTTTGAD